ncbi:MAG: hypothetical protein MHPSP_000381, partial [Paramarteilia canceri]
KNSNIIKNYHYQLSKIDESTLKEKVIEDLICTNEYYDPETIEKSDLTNMILIPIKEIKSNNSQLKSSDLNCSFIGLNSVYIKFFGQIKIEDNSPTEESRNTLKSTNATKPKNNFDTLDSLESKEMPLLALLCQFYSGIRKIAFKIDQVKFSVSDCYYIIKFSQRHFRDFIAPLMISVISNSFVENNKATEFANILSISDLNVKCKLSDHNFIMRHTEYTIPSKNILKNKKSNQFTLHSSSVSKNLVKQNSAKSPVESKESKFQTLKRSLSVSDGNKVLIKPLKVTDKSIKDTDAVIKEKKLNEKEQKTQPSSDKVNQIEPSIKLRTKKDDLKNNEGNANTVFFVRDSYLK